MGRATIVYREDVVSALDEHGVPLRAEVRTVLRTRAGKAVLNLAAVWGGKRVAIVELPEERKRRE